MKKISNTKRELLRCKKNIIWAYIKGSSLRVLAVDYDTSVGSIRALLIEEGIPRRPIGRHKKEN